MAVLTGNYSIGFLHMRKAGGTTVLRLVDNWMHQNECFRSKNEHV